MPGVIAAVEDLFFGARLLETARQLSVPLRLVNSATDLLTQARTSRPDLVILDLDAAGCRPLDAIRELKADPDLAATPVLGFLSHLHRDLKRAAAEAGCDRILARSAFTAELAEILRQGAPPS